VDMFGSHAGTSETPPDGFVSVLLVVGVALCLFKPFGFLVVLQLFSQCRNPFGDESDVSWSLEALWSDFVKWQVLVCQRIKTKCKKFICVLGTVHTTAHAPAILSFSVEQHTTQPSNRNVAMQWKITLSANGLTTGIKLVP